MMAQWSDIEEYYPRQIETLAYHSNQTAGNLNVVVIKWKQRKDREKNKGNPPATLDSVTDRLENTYTLGKIKKKGKIRQCCAYAKDIAGGHNIVTVAFSEPVYIQLNIAEVAEYDRR